MSAIPTMSAPRRPRHVVQPVGPLGVRFGDQTLRAECEPALCAISISRSDVARLSHFRSLAFAASAPSARSAGVRLPLPAPTNPLRHLPGRICFRDVGESKGIRDDPRCGSARNPGRGGDASGPHEVGSGGALDAPRHSEVTWVLLAPRLDPDHLGGSRPGRGRGDRPCCHRVASR